jgi:hypothetical protein
VNKSTHYINTDLDLSSTEALSDIATVLQAQGLSCLYMNCENTGLWQASFESEEQRAEPEASIAQMISIVESLPLPLQTIWSNCRSRIFDIGYNCGDYPWAFNQTLSNQLLTRISAANAAVRVTLYPIERNREESKDTNPQDNQNKLAQNA